MCGWRRGAYFPGDRNYAIEGWTPSGSRCGGAQHTSKRKFTAPRRGGPSLARVKTRLDDPTGRFHVGDASGFGVETELATAEGRAVLERFLQGVPGRREQTGTLRVLESPPGYRFMDHPLGYIGDEPRQRAGGRAGAGRGPSTRCAFAPTSMSMG